MELNTMAQSTRKTIISAVFQYRFRKGRLSIASWKLLRISSLGKMVGGMARLSGMVLELVRIIHTKGKIIMTEPRIRAA